MKRLSNRAMSSQGFSKRFKNSNGQLSIFVALIFQILFVLFAMVVNVGLLVHHKINLQNSVDIAAYYGAMKQAEMLNAISHINYQIRQSWKLLNFRMHVVGNAGMRPSPEMQSYHWQNGANVLIKNDSNTQFLAPDGTPFKSAFCSSYSPIKDSGTQPNESYCMPYLGGTIPRIQVTNIIGAQFGFLGFQTAIRNAAIALRNQQLNACVTGATNNWVNAVTFLFGWKMDVANRKEMLVNLANELSKSDKDFLDIESQSVRIGVDNTLKKNLTKQNKAQVQFETYNSLGAESCGIDTGNQGAPPKWLSEVLIMPLFYFIDSNCNGNNADQRQTAKLLNFPVGGQPSLPTDRQLLNPNLQDWISLMQQVIIDAQGQTAQARYLRSSLGYEKNPNCMAYYGVSAKTQTAIPFWPNPVELTARGFAKPFGGRIGPWYGKRWQINQPQSEVQSPNDKTESPAPRRIGLTIPVLADLEINSPDAQDLFGTYARYIGDQFGLFSNLSMSHFVRAIHLSRNENVPADKEISIRDWQYVLEEQLAVNTSGDILAYNYNSQVPRAPPYRDLEIMAIAPNQFDIGYYSIEPNFYENYLLKIEKGYKSKWGSNFHFRGDLGSRMNDENLKKFGIRDQIAVLDPSKKVRTLFEVPIREKMPFFLEKKSEVLTSWKAQDPSNYTLDSSSFANCENPVPPNSPLDRQNPGDCIVGGRVGYSVKIVSGAALKSNDIELGGKDIKGPIRNPPPQNF